MAHTKIGLGMLVTALALLVSGCKTFTTAPVFYSNNTHYDFIILGEVTYESSTATGFRELLKAARAQYPNCDYVIDVMVDSKTTTTKFFWMKKASTSYTMRGTAIQYIYKNSDGQTIARPVPTPIPPARTPAASTGAAASAETAVPVRIAERYTVERCDRAVRRDKIRDSSFVAIKKGDVLTDDTFVRVDRGSLVLTNGSTTVTIPAGQSGIIADLVTQR